MSKVILSDTTALVVTETEFHDEYVSGSARFIEDDNEVSVSIHRFFIDRDTLEEYEGLKCLHEHANLRMSVEQARAFADLLLKAVS
jgi:hypothetical protein